MPKLIYTPRSSIASPVLVYSSPKGAIELKQSIPVDVTEPQLDWLKSKYKDFKLAVESREIVVINDVSTEAGVDEKPPEKPPNRGKAALPELPPPPQKLDD